MNKVFLTAVVCLSLGACATARDERMAQGAMIGGAGGAIIGGVASGNVGGALVGGVAGAAVGAVGADMTRPRHYHSKQCHYSDVELREICTYR
jgi:uncharacterized membrane protein